MRKANAGVQKAAQCGIVELKTLEHTHDQLLATIEDSIRIQAEGRRQRLDAEEQIERMQRELRDRLTNGHDKDGWV